MPEVPTFSHPYEYTALRPIEHGNARAFNPGDGVPADHVERLGLEVGVDVAKAGSKAETAAMPVDPQALKGQALEQALADASLPTDGTAEEKRQRLAEHRMLPA